MNKLFLLVAIYSGKILSYCELKPREIVQRCPQEFADVKEIYRLNINLIDGSGATVTACVMSLAMTNEHQPSQGIFG